MSSSGSRTIWFGSGSPSGSDFLKGGEAAREAMLQTGWVDNKVLSLGDEIYATQYVLRKERRPA